MKRFVSFLVLSMVTCGAMAANNARPAMSNRIMAAPRYTASINQLNGMGIATGAVKTTQPVVEEEPKVDMREAERNACINNNIGIGNTFVWASRFSDTSNYANMIEDTTNPENNVCFVRVELKSDDTSRVSVADIPAKYFMWGESIECGSWADEKMMEQRILDARKGARIGGIVASTVGGAGLGVGAMELIGNTSIKGWKGQKGLEGADLYKSILRTYDVNSAEYKNVTDALAVIRDACESGAELAECETYKDLFEEFAK